MRISDWSSDVCSSDLGWADREVVAAVDDHLRQQLASVLRQPDLSGVLCPDGDQPRRPGYRAAARTDAAENDEKVLPESIDARRVGGPPKRGRKTVDRKWGAHAGGAPFTFVRCRSPGSCSGHVPDAVDLERVAGDE